MKTKQEILAFFGVEIGKRYRITHSSSKISEPKIFSVEETTYNYGGLRLIFEGTNGDSNGIALLTECCYEEVKPPILDNKEREYLQHYVMNNPAFKGKVEYIVKYLFGEREYIAIHLTTICTAFLPEFEQNSKYKGMELRKKYTPQELGLKE